MNMFKGNINQPIVSVCMITYNQEKYIAKAMESVIMQKTNFDYELVIGEDCSEDRTREICRNYKNKYPGKIKLFLQERNLGSNQNFIFTFQACDGEYIAMLEGDDYWTDPYKLQKQIDFLEANPDYGLVHTDFDVWDERSSRYVHSYNRSNRLLIPQGYIYEKLLIKNFIGTCTACFIKELISDFVVNDLVTADAKIIIDKFLWLEIARKSKIAYIDESTSAYRRLINSAIHTEDNNKKLEIHEASYKARFYFIKKYGCSGDTKKVIIQRYNQDLIRIYFNLKNSKELRKAYRKLSKISKLKNLVYLVGSVNNGLWYIINGLLYFIKNIRTKIVFPPRLSHIISTLNT